jgi:hypothetical protein
VAVRLWAFWRWCPSVHPSHLHVAKLEGAELFEHIRKLLAALPQPGLGRDVLGSFGLQGRRLHFELQLLVLQSVDDFGLRVELDADVGAALVDEVDSGVWEAAPRNVSLGLQLRWEGSRPVRACTTASAARAERLLTSLAARTRAPSVMVTPCCRREG